MHNATLSVNLAALRANYRLLCKRHTKKNAAAVVKANAYGLGVTEVSKALVEEGCELFFVATLDEAIELRTVLPYATIAVFNGIFDHEKKLFTEHNIIPVVNDPMQLGWCNDIAYMLHIDTGMTRLGFTLSDLALAKFPKPPTLILSHLACANEPNHPKNAEQLSRLVEALKSFPNVPVSFVNSSGHFLPADYHFNIGRPGCAIYGINPILGDNPMQHVATLAAPILQIRTLDRDESIGYSATANAPKASRLAVAGMGYSDGYFRSLSNQSFGYIGNYKLPIIGRISMDMITLDASLVPDTILNTHQQIEFINEKQPVDVIASEAHTIGYEVFTRIGRRVKRVYI